MSSSSTIGKVVGSAVRRVEDKRILTGRGTYVDDIVVRDMLHATFVRSPHAHALITGVETAAAEAAPGVVAVITGSQMAELANPLNFGGEVEGLRTPVYAAIAADKVRFVGEPVAIVIAESRYLAEDAADLVTVDYDPLPVVMSTAAGDADDAPVLFEELGDNVIYRNTTTHGDIDEAFERADHVVEATFSQHRWAMVPMECRGAVAEFDTSSDMLTYHASTQTVHLWRFFISTGINHPAHLVRVVAPDIGGAFGMKFSVYREDIALSAAAKHLRRSVKWIEDRNENLVAGGQAREEELHCQVAVSADGELLGGRFRMTLDHGAYPIMPPSTVFTGIVRTTLPGPYRWGAYSFESNIIATNKASYVSYRGPWAVETLVRERLLDMIARKLDMTPEALRLRNLIGLDEQPTKMITGATLDEVTARETFEHAMTLVDLEAFRHEQVEAREQGRLLGLGMATFIEPAPGTPDFWAAVGFPFGPEAARARLEPDGHVTVYTSQVPHGQSHETTLAQLAADEMGVPFDHVRVVHGDTDVTPFSMIGTGGSRAATMASGGVVMATREVKRRVLDLAGAMLEVSPEDLEIAEGNVAVKGAPDKAVPLAQIAMGCYLAPEAMPVGIETNLEANAMYEGEEGGWSQATHLCWVEVDPMTGQVRIPRFLVVEDCGPMINPAVVEGQVRGGVAQGIGGMLYEHSAYGEDGQYLAGTFMDYLVPSATEIPSIEVHHLEHASRKEIGYRGVGEGGTVLAPAALTNAIEDALHHLGVEITTTPLSPTRILELMGVVPVAA